MFGETCVLRENLPFTTDDGVGSRARIGVIALATDLTLEHELSLVTHAVEGVECFTARIENDVSVTPETLHAMKARIAKTTDLILRGADLDVVAFGCTSASMVIGEEQVFAEIKKVQPDAHCTTPITAAFAAFKHLNAKRIAVLTPYRADVNDVMRAYIEARGFQIPVFGTFNEEHDPTVAKIDSRSLHNGIRTLIEGQDVDAIFVSCTNIRLINEVPALEKEFGLPVTSSNHALAWHAMQLAEVTDPISGLGRLFG